MLNPFKKLSLYFSWNRVKSPTINPIAKSFHGNAQANSGNNAEQQMAVGNIVNHYYAKDKNPIAEVVAWKTLLKFFSEDQAQKIIEWIKDPLTRPYFDLNLDGWKKFIIGKFNNVTNPKITKELAEIREKALSAIDHFVQTRDEMAFKQTWKSLGEDLGLLDR